MKAAALILLLAVYSIECRKVVPINKKANIDFINMEMGSGYNKPNVPSPAAGPSNPAKPPSPAPASPAKPEPPKTPTASAPKSPVPPVTTIKPVPVELTTAPSQKPIPPYQPMPGQPKPGQGLPTQMDLKPVPGKAAPGGGVTTPGYGNVKQLVTFYDSQGKASVIRPHSYSQAVKQG